MNLESYRCIISALNQQTVQYIVVGGMAVVAHGYGRMTFDVDLVVHLKTQNILRAFVAFTKLGYRPRVPITAEQFADATLRQGWRRDKGMQVLNLFSDIHQLMPVDVFVYEPFPFDVAYERAERASLGAEMEFRYADLETLIRMKREAGRPKDLDDIEHLRMLQ